MSVIEDLKRLINKYHPINSIDLNSKILTFDFVNNNDNIGKSNTKGHITGSGFVINAKKDKILLNHHYKLDKWIQFGGHLENNEKVIEAAKRETIEETGINEIRILSEDIYDIDIHEIPFYQGISKHFHYDIRFLIEINDQIKPFISDESNNIKWINLEEIHKYTSSESILRMIRKL